MAQPWTRDGSTTSMPDISIPVHRNRNDTGVGSQSGSTEYSNRVSLTPQERLRAIEWLTFWCIDRETHRSCLSSPSPVHSRGHSSLGILAHHLNTSIWTKTASTFHERRTSRRLS
ncbi:hypothetical protein OUZ56_011599 [Daphnia magna]|uniref:Uncharacterized protein n=1 Tax=Daphnia magna TaxID=35525 RepID=A0ABQ9Z0T9_9CRUS|nr:hypothetical protein OUZ56_011599 [Daphnia magna]